MFTFPTEEEEAEKERNYLAEKDAQLTAKRENLGRLRTEVERDKSFLDQIGETSWEAVKSTGSGIMSVLDTLGTFGQGVAGVSAKVLFGSKGYEDLDLWDAAKLGAEKNRSQLDNIREAGILKNHPVLRGAVGFLADVATDPLSWVSVFPQGASIAGKALSKVPLETINGNLETAAQISKRIEGAHFKNLTSLLGDIPEGQYKQMLTAEAGLKAQSKARHALEQAIAFSAKQKSYQRSGVASLTPEAVSAANAKDLVEMGIGGAEETLLSLKNAVDIDKLYKRRTIRFSSPFAGIPGIGENMPILGTREADIPVVSEAISRIHDGLENAYYGTKMKVRNWIPEAMADDSPYFNRFAASFLNSVGNKVEGAHAWTTDKLGKVSQRISSTGRILGSRQVSDQLTNDQRDKQFLIKVVAAKASVAGDEIAKFTDGADIMTHITRAQDAVADVSSRARAQARQAIEDLGLKGNEKKIALEELRKKSFTSPEMTSKILGEEIAKRIPDPQKQQAALRLADHIQKRNEAIFLRDKEAGLLENALDNYILHAFDPTDYKGDWNSVVSGTMRHAAKVDLDGMVDFTQLRKYGTIQQAVANGLKPEENALKLLIAREHASELAHLQKEFAERMAWQHGVRPEIYQGLTAIAKDESNRMRSSALKALAELDITNRADLTVPALQFNDGRVINAAAWDNLADTVKFADPQSPALADAIRNTTQMRTIKGVEIPVDEFFANTQYRNLIDTLATKHEQSQQMIPGYIGESALAKAGGVTIRPFLRAKMLKNLSPEDAKFWDNIIPTHLASALEESYATGDWLKRHIEKNHMGKVKNDTIKALDGTLGFLGEFNKVLKAGMLSIWPARYVRDLTSAGVQAGLVMSPIEQIGAIGKNLAQFPLQAGAAIVDGLGGDGSAAKLGQFLNIPSIVHANDIFTGADLITNSNKVISNKQLQLAALRGGFEWNGNYATDLVASINDMLDELVQSPAMRGAIPGLTKMVGRERGLTAAQKGSAWVAKKAGLPLDDRFWQRFPDFAERLERYGRTNTFIELVKRDFDFEEAASLANRMHVDYKNAKTPFERKFLNNLFFFYSFSRGNASTLAQNLMMKPGALTTQMHMREAIAEMLKDPSVYYEDPDAENLVRSKRLNESMGVYIGTNKESGIPTYLSGAGLPIEDITKFSAVTLPNSLSARDVIRAGAQTAKRSAALVGSQTNPLIKTAIEVMTGRSLFYDRPLTDETLRKIPKWERDSSLLKSIPFRAVPKEVWEGLDAVTKVALDAKDNGDGTFTVNPYAMALMTVVLPGLSSIAPGNPVIGALSPLKYSSRFLSTRRSLTEPGKADTAKALNFLTGLKIDEIDPESSALYDESRDLKNYMEYLGIPKGKLRREKMLQAESEDE